MEFRKGSNLDLILKLVDVDGNPLRAKDTAGLKVYVWTTDRNNYLAFSKQEVLEKGKADVVVIPGFFMETLESGVLCYNYDYSIYDPSLRHNSEVHRNVRETFTDIYWRNSNFNQIPSNPVNYQTLDYIKGMIVRETIAREEEMKEIGQYLEGDGSVANETEARKEADDALQALIDAEVERATGVEDELRQMLDEVSPGEGTLGELKAEIEEELARKQDILAAGDNIVIDGDTINAVVPTKVSELENDVPYLVKSDLSDYAKSADVASEILSATEQIEKELRTKQDEMRAGNHIEIEDNVISVVDCPDRDETNDAINDAITELEERLEERWSSIDNQFGYIRTDITELESGKQDVLTAGDNVTIDGTTISATVPTKVSELENDSGYVTETAIPTKVSELENDSGFITEDDEITEEEIKEIWS